MIRRKERERERTFIHYSFFLKNIEFIGLLCILGDHGDFQEFNPWFGHHKPWLPIIKEFCKHEVQSDTTTYKLSNVLTSAQTMGEVNKSHLVKRSR